jgi:alpha-beta hydrolase superfamily lysophospholipase
MKTSRYYIFGKFDVKLHVLSVLPEDDPIAVIVMLHGMGEHKERYLEYAKWMAAKGYAVFVHDHRKHGQSIDEDKEEKVGIFGPEDKWEYIIDDVHFVVKDARKKVPGKEIVILGHSMGSIIARRYISKYSQVPKAVILSGTLPIIKFSDVFLPINLARVCNVFRKNTPSKLISNALNKPLNAGYEEPRTPFEWLSKDEKVVDAYIADPLCGYAYNARFYIEFLKGIKKANTSDNISDTRNIPILFIAGKDDPVGEFGDGVEDVYKIYMGHGFFEVRLMLLAGNRHEILNEPDRLETYQTIEDWLKPALGIYE